jgi:hypothetical protein
VRRTAILGLMALLGGAAERLPDAATPRAPERDLDPSTCGACHVVAAAAWSTSRHARAFTDPAFQAEREPGHDAWCLGCHREGGVSCVACHAAPHADPPFASTAPCARCHEFKFPLLDDHGARLADTPLPMQETVTQFESAHAAGRCIDCHDPHAARGAHDPDTLASALSLDACTRDHSLFITLTNDGAGHNVPSGGIDRHMILRVWRSDAPAGLARFVFGRTFRRVPSGGKETTADTTIPAGATRTFTIDDASLGSTDDEPIHVDLRERFVPDGRSLADRAEEETIVLSRRLLWRDVPLCDDAR